MWRFRAQGFMLGVSCLALQDHPELEPLTEPIARSIGHYGMVEPASSRINETMETVDVKDAVVCRVRRAAGVLSARYEGIPADRIAELWWRLRSEGLGPDVVTMIPLALLCEGWRTVQEAWHADGSPTLLPKGEIVGAEGIRLRLLAGATNEAFAERALAPEP